ncbi:MAG: glycosyltransferase family 2 protein [Candidatus Bathyarchaeia archaeon]|nr:glycosyltransferase family 2 protein [Candidatus Bathyarchaeota archaeon]
MKIKKPIDVVILTKNSEGILRECLTSVYENVPVNRLIVLDAYSTDGTRAIIEEFDRKYGNAVFISMNGNRAQARERGIKEVETEWFMFVDSDVVLCKNWFKKAAKHVGKNVGAIWGLNFDITPNIKSRILLRFLAFLAERCFNLRGGMHDTLIRREALEGIRIPEQLHAYEDAYIINWIKGRGYRVVIGDDLYCIHYRQSHRYTLNEGIKEAVNEIRCGLIYSHIYSYILYYPLLTFNWVLQAIYNVTNSPQKQ